MAQGMAMTAKGLTMATHPCMPMMLHSHGKELTKETDMGEPCLKRGCPALSMIQLAQFMGILCVLCQ